MKPLLVLNFSAAFAQVIVPPSVQFNTTTEHFATAVSQYSGLLTCLLPLDRRAEENPAAKCFAIYSGWEAGFPEERADAEKCAGRVGMAFPEQFVSRYAKTFGGPHLPATGAGVPGGPEPHGPGRVRAAGAGAAGRIRGRRRTYRGGRSADGERSYAGLVARDPALGDLYAPASGHQIETFPNPCYGGRTGRPGCDRWGPRAAYNASLAIVGAVATSGGPVGGYFSDLQEMFVACDGGAGGKAPAAGGGPHLGLDLVRDMVFLGFLQFVHKDAHAAVAAGADAPLSSLLTPRLLRSLWFCTHSYSGVGNSTRFRASVPYFHLHTSNRIDYPEFIMGDPKNPVLTPNNLTKSFSWDRFGAVCVRLAETDRPYEDKKIDTSTVQAGVDAVGLRLWRLVMGDREEKRDVGGGVTTGAEF